MPLLDNDDKPKVYQATDTIGCHNPRVEQFRELTFVMKVWFLRKHVFIGDEDCCIECNFACVCKGWGHCDECSFKLKCKLSCHTRV